MQFKSPIKPDTLKVGDIISKWGRYSSRTTLGSGSGHFERRRHLIIGLSDYHVSTVGLLWKPLPGETIINPGSNYDIPTATIRGVLNWRIAK